MKPLDEPDLSAIHVPGFELLRAIGRGGMGMVYLARQKSLDRLVAVKILGGKTLHHTDSERFQQEAETLARLDHPNIVTIIDRGLVDRRHYFVMEYVDGRSLKDYEQRGDLTVGQLLAMIRSVGQALAAAHDAGVIHRDVKPSNVLFQNDGRVMLSDFGIASIVDLEEEAEHEAARLARERSIKRRRRLAAADNNLLVGTFLYMSPEQAVDSATVTARSDIYSFGLLIWEALTGEVPTAESRYPSEMTRLATRDTDEALLRALEENPEDRFESAEELAQAVIVSIPRRLRKKTERPVRDFYHLPGLRRTYLIAGFICVLCLLLVGLAIFLRETELVNGAEERQNQASERVESPD